METRREPTPDDLIPFDDTGAADEAVRLEREKGKIFNIRFQSPSGGCGVAQVRRDGETVVMTDIFGLYRFRLEEFLAGLKQSDSGRWCFTPTKPAVCEGRTVRDFLEASALARLQQG